MAKKKIRRHMGKGFSKDGTDSKQTGGIDRKTRSRWRTMRTHQPRKVAPDDPARGEWIPVGPKKKRKSNRKKPGVS